MRDYPTSIGGIQSAVFTLHKKLISENVKVTVILNKKSNSCLNINENDRLTIVRMNFPILFNKIIGRRFVRFLLYSPYFIYKIGRFTKNKNSVIHAHWLEDGIIAGLIGKCLKIPIIWTCHGPIHARKFCRINNKMGISNIFYKFAISGISHIVTVSEFLANIIKSDCNKLRKKISVIPNSVESDRFREKEMSKGHKSKINLIYAGRLVKHKGVLDLLMSMIECKNNNNNNVYLKIVGDGPLFEEILRLIKENDLSNLVGVFKSTNHLATLYSASNAYVSASPGEGLPIAPLEAMASGLLPILSDIPPHREILGDPPTGMLFPVGDYRGLANIFHSLTLPRCQEFGKRSKIRVKSEYSPIQSANRYKELFCLLLNGQKVDL